jgi:glycosyltransferase involved in cell wall biosynthesis
MNIVLVSNSYFPQLGGLEVAVNNIAKGLAKTGHKVTVITGNSSVRYSKEVETLGVVVYRIPFFLPRVVTVAGYQRMVHSIYKSFLSPFIIPRSLFKFRRILEPIKPDIVNIHYIGENAVFCLLAKKWLNFKFVVNLHGNDIDRYSERSVFSRWLTKRTLLTADRVLSNSSYILKKAEEIEPAIKEKSAIVGNGVYLKEFDSVFKYPHSRRYILSIANFTYNKGLDILIQAFYMLQKEYQNIDLIIAGDGPELNRCVNLTNNLGLTGSIKFLGKVKKPVIPSLLTGCEVFVLPSRKEAFGISILEAMACKKPVISTRVGGVKEIVTHLNNGLLVEPESPEALMKGIELLLNNHELANFIAKNGYDHITKNFTWDKIVQKYVAEYKRLLI